MWETQQHLVRVGSIRGSGHVLVPYIGTIADIGTQKMEPGFQSPHRKSVRQLFWSTFSYHFKVGFVAKCLEPHLKPWEPWTLVAFHNLFDELIIVFNWLYQFLSQKKFREQLIFNHEKLGTWLFVMEGTVWRIWLYPFFKKREAQQLLTNQNAEIWWDSQCDIWGVSNMGSIFRDSSKNRLVCMKFQQSIRQLDMPVHMDS